MSLGWKGRVEKGEGPQLCRYVGGMNVVRGFYISMFIRIMYFYILHIESYALISSLGSYKSRPKNA